MDVIMKRCLGRMANFVKLTIRSIDAEFPHWEIVQAFRVLDLREGRVWKPGSHSEDLERIAGFCCVDERALHAQYEDHRPFALRVFKASAAHEGNTSNDAWRQAVVKTQSRASTRVAHPADVLLVALHKYNVFCGLTTSGVEHSGSIKTRIISKQRGSLAPRTEFTDMKIAVDLRDEEIPDVINRARKIWATRAI